MSEADSEGRTVLPLMMEADAEPTNVATAAEDEEAAGSTVSQRMTDCLHRWLLQLCGRHQVSPFQWDPGFSFSTADVLMSSISGVNEVHDVASCSSST